MDINNTQQAIEANLEADDSNQNPNQNQFESNQSSNQIQLESNHIRLESNQNQFEPIFPLTKTVAAKLLGKTDAGIAKWIDNLFTVYTEVEKDRFFYKKKKITEWGFEQLVIYSRATSPNFAQYDRATGETIWNADGTPVAMVENENRIPVKNYLRNLQNSLLVEEVEILAEEIEIGTSALVPVDLNEIAALEAISMDKIETDALFADAKRNLEKTELTYQKVRAIQRRKAATRGALDAAEDAQIYTKAYQAAASHIEKKKLETDLHEED
ncbi:MAG: hypothetical protein QNJ38_22170 [Prochloraceae cyanobacterium]|nr:hypothetical protein [Prochloraceae cyanobacterium]